MGPATRKRATAASGVDANAAKKSKVVATKKRARAEEDEDIVEEVVKRANVEEVKEEEVVKKEEVDPVETPEEREEKIRKIKEQSRIAVRALSKYASDKEEKALFPETDCAVNVLVTYKKQLMVNGPIQKKRIILPHPTVAATSAMFCVIMPDLDISQKGKMDHQVDKQALQWEEKIEAAHGLTRANISKVLTKTQLEREYKSFRRQRQLASAYDVFLVEKTVHKSVHSFLGKEFIRAHKMPLTFDFQKDMKAVLERAAATTIYNISSYQKRTSVAAGHLAQPLPDITENVEHVLNEIVANAPGGLINIRSLFVQISKSGAPSMPIYADDGPSNAVTMEQPTKRREQKEIKDDLSTLPEGLSVAVSRDGRVRVIDDNSGKGVIYPTNKDEWIGRGGLKGVNIEKLMKKRQNKKERSKKKKETKAAKKETKAVGKSTFGVLASGMKKNKKGVKKEEVKNEAKKEEVEA